MRKAFIHALEGEPDDPVAFSGRSERDIRARWLTWNDDAGTPGPWAVSKTRTIPNGILLEPSDLRPAPAHLDEVHLVFVSDGAELARRLASRTNDRIHFAPALTDPDTFAALIGNRAVKVVPAGGISTFYLAFRLKLLDQTFRTAVAHALDVHKLAPIGQGAASPALTPVPPTMRGHDPTLRQARFDPDRARSLVRTTRSGRPRRLELLCPPAPTYAGKLGVAVADELTAHLGAEVVPIHRPTWGDMLREWKTGRGHMLIASWHQRHARPGDPYPLLRALFHSAGSGNLTGYTAADRLLCGSGRNHRKAQAAILRHAPILFLSHWRRLSAYQASVLNLHLLPGALPEDRLVNVDIA